MLPSPNLLCIILLVAILGGLGKVPIFKSTSKAPKSHKSVPKMVNLFTNLV